MRVGIFRVGKSFFKRKCFEDSDLYENLWEIKWSSGLPVGGSESRRETAKKGKNIWNSLLLFSRHGTNMEPNFGTFSRPMSANENSHSGLFASEITTNSFYWGKKLFGERENFRVGSSSFSWCKRDNKFYYDDFTPSYFQTSWELWKSPGNKNYPSFIFERWIISQSKMAKAFVENQNIFKY